MIRIKILDEKKNPILKRTDLMLMIDHTGQPTPKTDEVVKKIVEKFKTSPEKVEVVYTFSQKGIARSKVKVRIWKEKAPVKKVKKKEEEAKEAVEEKPGEKPKQEKPVEKAKKPEKAEELKPEEKEELKGEKTK